MGSHLREDGLKVLSTLVGFATILIGVRFLVDINVLLGLFLMMSGLLLAYSGLREKKNATVNEIPTSRFAEDSLQSFKGAHTITFPSTSEAQPMLIPLSSPYGPILIHSSIQDFGRDDFIGVVAPWNLKYISGKHFRVQMLQGKLYIEDLGSKNGTFVNGRDIRGMGPVPLNEGDLVNVAGILELRVKY